MKFKETNLSKLNQISDKRSALFAKLNVHNLEDLLFFYPRTYEDWTDLTPLHLLTDGSLVTIKAKLIKEPKIQYRGRLSWLRSYLSDGVTVISVIWFNQPWLMKKLEMEIGRASCRERV